jgi:CRP-like cAMP-binding protein
MGTSSGDDENPTGAQANGARETPEMAGMMSEAAALFRSSEIFEGLTPEELREIIQLAEHRALDAGDLLFAEGDDAEALYVVADGAVEVRSHSPGGEPIVLADLGPGSVVGEMSILEGGERSATVEALRNAELFRVSRGAFESLRSRDHPVAYKIIMGLCRLLGERRRETDERVQKVFRDPAEHLEDFEEQVHEMLGKIKKA